MLSKSLSSAQKQMAAIDKFSSSRAGLAAARTKFRETEQAVVAAARAMKSGVGNANELDKAYNRAVRSVENASKAFDKQRASVLANKAALDRMGIPADKAVAYQRNLQQAIERTNSALDKQPSRLSRAASAARRVGGNVAGNVAPLMGPAILMGTKAAVHAGAEVQSEIVRMQAAGIPQADIDRAVDQSNGMMGKYSNVSRSQSLERFKELRSIMLNPEEAHEMLPLAVQATSAMNAVDSSGEMAKGLNFGFRGAEVLGLGQDPKRMRAYIDSFIKAQQVMGKTITPEMQYEFAKYAKASGATLSDRFKMTTGVSLSQELGGSTTGNSIDQFVKQVTGGFQGNQHSAAKEFVAYGLAKKDDFEQTKNGGIKGLKTGHKVAGSDLAQTDPDKWVDQYLMPALIKNGKTTLNDQIGEVRRLFPSGRSADLVAKLISQRESFSNHAKLYDEAQGLNADNSGDPFNAFGSITTAFKNFAGVMTQPIMQSASSAMTDLASSIGNFGGVVTGWQKAHPNMAKGAAGGVIAGGLVGGSVLTYSLLNGLRGGFGLTASSVALDGSAAALSAAAAELAGGKLPGLLGKPGSAPAAAAAGGGVLSKVWAAGAAALPFAAPIALGTGAYLLAEGDNEQRGITRDSTRARMHRQAAKYNWWGKYDPMDTPQITPTMTYGTGVGGSPTAAGPVSVTGTVSGQGEITVKFEAGSSLLQVVDQARAAIRLAGQINNNGPGSAGLSSPDTAAPAKRAGTGSPGASGGW